MMEHELGLRSRQDRLLDSWGRLNMWGRYGLSFVGAIAILVLVIEVVDWFL